MSVERFLTVGVLMFVLSLLIGRAFAQETLPIPAGEDEPSAVVTPRAGLPASFSLVTADRLAYPRETVVNLTWMPSAGATSYKLVVKRHDGKVIEKLNLSAAICGATCSYTLVKPVKKVAEYNWRVIALNESGKTKGGKRFFSVHEPVAFQMLNLVNSERCNRGLVPLALNGRLALAATNHSKDMGKKFYFSHDSLNGATPWNRMHAQGYFYTSAAENLAAGNATAQNTFNQWMDSKGHQDNIRNPNLREMGLGYFYNASAPYRYYWTQKFGARGGAVLGTCP